MAQAAASKGERPGLKRINASIDLQARARAWVDEASRVSGKQPESVGAE